MTAKDTSMPHAGSMIEGDLDKQLLSLNLNKEADLSCDSFSSAPDFKQKRGVIAFMELVESILVAQQEQAIAIKFENLVDDKIDMNIETIL